MQWHQDFFVFKQAVIGGTKMQALIVYFSRPGENYSVGYIEEGNAKHIAKVISKYTKAPLYELEPLTPYASDYKECVKEAVKEAKEEARPAFKNPLADINKYDVIYLCYPNWCGTFPRIVASFLAKYDFTNKIIKPMCTHEGSGMGFSERELAKTLPTATILPGLPIKGSECHKPEIEETIKEWAFKLTK